MGCDIHALIERRVDHKNDNGDVYRTEWINSGDPDIGRNYEMFASLAGVRNYNEVTPVAEPRGLPAFKGWNTYSDGERWISWDHEGDVVRPCREMEHMAETYGEDGHSASWLTLAAIKAYDTDQVIHDKRLVLARDDGGKATMLAGWTSGENLGEVGETKILRWPGEDEPTRWLRLIRYMEQAKWDGQSDHGVRLVFFFDN